MFTRNGKACQDPAQTLCLDRVDQISVHLQSYLASVPVSLIVPIILSQYTLRTVYVVNPLLSHDARLIRASHESICITLKSNWVALLALMRDNTCSLIELLLGRR